jgi:hypothetical protein
MVNNTKIAHYPKPSNTDPTKVEDYVRGYTWQLEKGKNCFHELIKEDSIIGCFNRRFKAMTDGSSKKLYEGKRFLSFSSITT